MIKVGDNFYRNLEEQVLKNKQDIADHYNRDRVLGEFGIKIIGYAETASELPDPELYQGEYGDGYYVGDDAPYNFYIYTRPDPDAGYDTNYWLNIGPLSIAGPTGSPGPRGEIGPVGIRGSIWTSVYDTLPSPNDYNVNDQVLRTVDGNVYQLTLDTDENKYWKLNGNIQGILGILGIQGIQGIQGILGIRGEKGEKGDVGGFINIYGILPSSAQLPQPSTLNNLTVAYLIGSTTPYDLYVQVGSTSDTAVWTNTGPFNAATLVQVNGSYLNIWSPDSINNLINSLALEVANLPKYYQHSVKLDGTGMDRGACDAIITFISTSNTTITSWSQLLTLLPNGETLMNGIYYHNDSYHSYNRTVSINKSGVITFYYSEYTKQTTTPTTNAGTIPNIVSDTITSFN